MVTNAQNINNAVIDRLKNWQYLMQYLIRKGERDEISPGAKKYFLGDERGKKRGDNVEGGSNGAKGSSY